MFLSILKTRARLHAARVFEQILGAGYEGEVFLCGSAFQPLLKRKAQLNELDFWVRDRKERENLTRHLLSRGAVLARDLHPYSLKLRLDGRLIEITYHNVKDGNLADILDTSELSLSAIGARYEKGRIAEVHVTDECWYSVRRRMVGVLPSYLLVVQELRSPSIILTLHRMGQQAAELEFDVDLSHEHLLWEAFWNEYSEDERRSAMDLYFAATASSKGSSAYQLSRRASGDVASGQASDGQPLPWMTPQAV